MIFPTDNDTLNQYLMAQFERKTFSVLESVEKSDDAMFRTMMDELKDSFSNFHDLVRGMQFLVCNLSKRVEFLEKKMEDMEKKYNEITQQKMLVEELLK